MKSKIVIIGASAQASVVADILNLCGSHEVVGFIDEVSPQRAGGTFCGRPILGGAERLQGLLDDGVSEAIVGFGHSAKRLEAAATLAGLGYQLATAIHPQAVISVGATIGRGSVVKAGAIIDPGVTVHDNVLIGSGVLLTHGGVIHEGARIAAGATIGANAIIEKGAFIGTGVSVRTSARVGAFALVGVGSVVIEDIPAEMVAYGVPAVAVRRVSEDDY